MNQVLPSNMHHASNMAKLRAKANATFRLKDRQAYFRYKRLYGHLAGHGPGRPPRTSSEER